MDVSYHSPRMSPLDVSEVFGIVVDFVAKDDLEKRQQSNTPGFQGATTLANLAITCKSFRETSLDKLWQYQPSLTQLILCLPLDAVSVQSIRPRAHRKLVTLNRPITSPDLRRLTYYARKVKVLGSIYWEDNSSLGIRLAPNVLLNVLAAYRGVEPLFLRLRALHINIHESFEFALAEGRLLGPCLDSVLVKAKVPTSNPSGSLQEFPWLYAQRVVSPHLHKLKTFGVYIDCDEPRALPCSMPPKLDEMIKELKVVERLTITDVETSWALCQQMASYPILGHLEVSLAHNSSLTSTPISFPCLQSIHFTAPDPHKCAEALRIMTLPIIKSVAITIDGSPRTPSTWSLNPILQALGSQPSKAQISSLYIGRLANRPDEQLDVEPIDGGSFEYLFPFHNLHHLEINLNARIHLDAYTVNRMGESWPQLRTLALEQRMSNSPPQLHLRDLLPLANFCPFLSYLSLRLDASSGLPEDLHGCKQFLALETFHICTSPIEDSSTVAKFVQAVMPKVQRVKYGWKYWCGEGYWPETPSEMERQDAKYEECWQKVNEILGGI